ncbi:hypothetical protein OIU74_002437 [Salix koriyanagi]|uniref:Leucine zipper homeobox-associated domain-containing protein n=1 Tax=Salix koriyanagi TaxID=2511006 RepID=A0A9Q1AP92_9ROSI|nr:hypothetical protein OIU74_002437 [Salix koriyanagi]
MELALTLGDTSKPFKFLDKTPRLSSKDLGFCMGLGSGFPATTRSQDKLGSHESNYQDDERRVSSDPPLQLDLLPFSPVPRRHQAPSKIRFPWLADNLVSDPGSTEAPGRGFDVNRLSMDDADEGEAISSPNSAATKLKQTEVDCEYLKRCCETLTEENRRLQKELQELRALKTSQPFYMQLPATTLTMCPSCERVATTTTSSSGTTTTTTTPSTTTTTSTTISKPRLFPLSHGQLHPPTKLLHGSL